MAAALYATKISVVRVPVYARTFHERSIILAYGVTRFLFTRRDSIENVYDDTVAPV